MIYMVLFGIVNEFSNLVYKIYGLYIARFLLRRDNYNTEKKLQATNIRDTTKEKRNTTPTTKHDLG